MFATIINFLFTALVWVIRFAVKLAVTAVQIAIIAVIKAVIFLARLAFFIWQGAMIGILYATWNSIGVKFKPAVWKLMEIMSGSYNPQANKAMRVNAMKQRVQVMVKPDERHKKLAGQGNRVFDMKPGTPLANTVKNRMKAIQEVDHQPDRIPAR